MKNENEGLSMMLWFLCWIFGKIDLLLNEIGRVLGGVGWGVEVN